MKHTFSALLLLSCTLSVFGTQELLEADTQYKLTDNYVGNAFFQDFAWFTNPDPTHGRVNYVDMQTAKNKGLSSGEFT